MSKNVVKNNKTQSKQLKQLKQSKQPKKVKQLEQSNRLKKGIKIDLQPDNEIEVLPSNNKVIEKIIVLADVHISTKIERHKEYRSVFAKLYKEVEQISSENLSKVVIVILGDICDSNTYLISEQIYLLKEFMHNLSSINDVDVIMILGNHDVNMNNCNIVDAISPIIYNFKTKNQIFLLTEDKVYEYANCLFGLTGMHSDVVTPCNIKTDKYKISLHHGTITSSKLRLEFTNKLKFDISDFEKCSYDWYLYGDLHKYQILNDKGNALFPGSLLSINYNERLYSHGIVVVDLVNNKSEFREIKNDWGYYRTTINEHGLDYTGELANLCANPTIEVYYENINYSDLTQYIKKLQKEHNAHCIIKKLNNNIDISVNITVGGSKKQIGDIKSADSVKSIIIDFIKKNNKYDNKTIKEINTALDNVIQNIKINNNRDYSKNRTKNLKLKNSNLIIFLSMVKVIF